MTELLCNLLVVAGLLSALVAWMVAGLFVVTAFGDPADCPPNGDATVIVIWPAYLVVKTIMVAWVKLAGGTKP